ncbi:flagellin [Thiomicrospira sp. ALE5]|uniref:flagellin N-terminal helical domain-containing protein n=1 Tax=Thiomicrospira sp. ALE5 TaxID=748650 RepID=UPI0008E72445|nr:flagellin [Thiomicrospira sp. ALE5]SFR59353.1 flagellin [Thiomicrospira sp. ALE5]
MSMVINTNMGAVNAQRILDTTSREQSVSMERLTSGLRINKAADDAAGLAVVTGMNTQSIGTQQAIRNANDSIGMVQTLDGASEEVVNMLQRMRELSLQSMNGTYNNENRVQMQAEFSQLQSEIERVADTTKFNGQNIMNASSFAASAVLSIGQVANSAFEAAASAAGAFRAHVGWEGGNDNRVGVALLDFNTLQAASTGTQLMTGNGSGITFASAVEFASAALSAIDNDLEAISTMRANWGAIQNRLDYTVANLQNVDENIQASRSRIEDADFAAESANLARTQVLQQAGMSMLSQSNQQSQNVLSLLR